MRPSWPLAGLVGMLLLLAFLGLFTSGLSPFAMLVLGVAALAIAVPSGWRMLRPSLSLRLFEDRVEYRIRPGHDWLRIDPQGPCFVSPWYIGWRNRRGLARGVFRAQLRTDDFRRLALQLRHRRLD